MGRGCVKEPSKHEQQRRHDRGEAKPVVGENPQGVIDAGREEKSGCEAVSLLSLQGTRKRKYQMGRGHVKEPLEQDQ